jgi:4-amino-4-deoxy-L-arabinose transferase-like glycosyltransferase
MDEVERYGGLRARLHRGPLAILLVIIAFAWLPGFFTLPPLDRDEARFAQATKQMLESGDFIAMRLGDQARDQKPVGIYWLQGLSTALLSDFVPASNKWHEIWTYRVPSILGAFAALAFTFWMGRMFAGVEAGFLAALLLGLTVLLSTEAKIAKTDAVLLACIVGAQSLMLRAFLSGHPKSSGITRPTILHAAVGWLCFGFGILVKGPVIVLICAATLIAASIWDRRVFWLARLRFLTGLPIAALIVVPWAIAIGIATNGAFYEASLGRDFALKLMGGQETHGAPPGYYLLLAPITFWPATLILIPTLLFGFWNSREPPIRFLMSWVLTTWIMFEAAPTKLPHYILPAYPALALLAGYGLMRGSAFPNTRLERGALYLSIGLFVLVGFGLAGFVLWAPYYFGRALDIFAEIALGIAALAVFGSAVAVIRGWLVEGACVAALAAIILYTVLGYAAVPRLDQLQLSPQIARAVATHRRAGDPPPLLSGYSEPSALFLLGTRTRFAAGGRAGELAAQSGGIVLVDRNEQQAFLREVETRHARAVPLQIIDGFNYSNGRTLRLFLYRVTRPGAQTASSR